MPGSLAGADSMKVTPSRDLSLIFTSFIADGPLPAVLQEVDLPIINNTECEAMYESAGFREHIPHIFICAGYREGGKDSCEVMTGAPRGPQGEIFTRLSRTVRINI